MQNTDPQLWYQVQCVFQLDYMSDFCLSNLNLLRVDIKRLN